MEQDILTEAAQKLAAAGAFTTPPGSDDLDHSPPVSPQELEAISWSLGVWRQTELLEAGSPRLEIKSVVGAMNRGFESEAVVADGAHLLGILAASSSALARQVASEQGVQVIIEGLVQFRYCRRVVTETVLALYHLSADEENRFLIADFDGIQATVDAMDIYDDDPALSADCLHLLIQLVEGRAVCNKIVLGKTWAIRKAVAYLNRYADVLDAQRLGCRAVGAFVTGCQSNAAVAVREAAHTAVFQSVRTLPDDPEVRLHGLWALESILENNQSLQQTMAPELVPILVQFLSGPETKPFDLLLIFQILRNLTAQPEGRKLFVEHKGIPGVTRILGESKNDDIFLLSCNILSNIGKQASIQGQECHPLAIQTIVENVQVLAAQADQLEMVMEAFSTVAEAEPGLTATSVSMSMAFLLVEILESYTQPRLRQCCLQVVESIAKVDSSLRSQFAKAGIIQTTHDVIRDENVTMPELESSFILLNTLADFSSCASKMTQEDGLTRKLEEYRLPEFPVCDELLGKLGKTEKAGRSFRSLFGRERSRAKFDKPLKRASSGAIGATGERSSSLRYSTGDLDILNTKTNSKSPGKTKFRLSSLLTPNL